MTVYDGITGSVPHIPAAVAGGVAFVFHHFAPLPLLKGTALLPLNRAAAPRLGVRVSADRCSPGPGQRGPGVLCCPPEREQSAVSCLRGISAVLFECRVHILPAVTLGNGPGVSGRKGPLQQHMLLMNELILIGLFGCKGNIRIISIDIQCYLTI